MGRVGQGLGKETSQQHLSKPLPQNPNKDPKLNDILEINAQVFDGLGKLKGQTVHLNIDPDANPKAQPQRRIPYHIRNKVKDAIITTTNVVSVVCT